MARKAVTITVDDALLEKVDEYAKEYFTNRSGVFAQAAAQYLVGMELKEAVRSMKTAFQSIAAAGKVDESTLRELEAVQRALGIMLNE